MTPTYRVTPFQVEFAYTNHRGEDKVVRAEVRSIRFGVSEYYSMPQWLMEAVDVSRNVERTYAMGAMSDVKHVQ